ncbi:MAG: gephyrin-like molybdotransferase Glp [Dongiaceae bacterium]
MTALLPVDEAIARVVAGVAAMDAETVPLADAAGRTLAEPLAARRTQPPFPASAMDGYAVRAADVAAPPARLRLIGASVAGKGFAGTVGRSEAVRIFTGAPVPEGADAVLIQENAETPEPAVVVAKAGVTPGRNIRPAGFDFRAGDQLLDAGRVFGAREIAITAAMGYGAVPVRRRPRVAIISTGDELVPPGTEPGPDQIVASNGPGIAAFARAHGADAHDLGIVRDDRADLAAAIDRAIALPADILVTLGGASVGDHDLVAPALADRGMQLDFWRIAMRPGKPLLSGRIARRDGEPDLRVLGLPGNPVSGLVCAILFLGPLVGAFLGHPATDPTEPAVLAVDVPANDSRQDYVRATLVQADRLPLVTPLPVQDSSGLAVLAKADCLLVRPPNAPAAKAGDPCRIIRLR